MSTTTQSSVPATIPAVQAEPDHVAEAKAYFAQCYRLAEMGSTLGNLALDELARKLGDSANKFGRPTTVAFIAFMLAMEGREKQLGITRRVGLAQVANKAVGLVNKPVFRVKAQASTGDGSLTYKLNMPVTFEVAIN